MSLSFLAAAFGRHADSRRFGHRSAGWGTGFSYDGFFESGQVVSAGNTLSGAAVMPFTTGAPDGKHSMAFGGSSIATLLAITTVRSQPPHPFQVAQFWARHGTGQSPTAVFHVSVCRCRSLSHACSFRSFASRLLARCKRHAVHVVTRRGRVVDGSEASYHVDRLIPGGG